MNKEELKYQAIQAIKELNIDPNEIAKIPMFGGLLEKFLSGKWTKRQFQTNCQKLGMMNSQIFYQ